MLWINYRNGIKLIIFFIFTILFYYDVSFASFIAKGNRPIDDKKWTTKYDEYFNKYTKRYFGVGFDSMWFKSQGIAESALNETAKSWVGAKGVMQIMPGTWKEIVSKNKHIIGDINQARWNIEAGIFYNKSIYLKWKSNRIEYDRLALMFGSYNAGMGYLLKGQKICQQIGRTDCNTWNGIKSVSDKVPIWKQEETIGYVKRIFGLMGISII